MRWRGACALVAALAGCGDNLGTAPEDASPPEEDAAPDAGACARPMTAAALATGWTHSLALAADGALATWGANGNGQLGVGDVVDRPLATAVTAGPWRAIAGGSRHSCGIRDDGTLWCWGVNVHGQLGVDDTEPRTLPTQVGTGADWAEVVCGGLHTCARTSAGAVWCWGANPIGQLGIGDVTGDQWTPQRVGEDSDWVALAARARHTCGLRADHSLWCWGDNSDGQVGQGDAGGSYRTPRRVVHPDDAGWRAVGTGAIHSCAIDDDERLFCWGDNQQGKLGLGDGGGDGRTTPARVGGDGAWRAVHGGWTHTCGLRADGELWCWGANTQGQLGLGDHADRAAPSAVAGGPWSALTVGGDHTCALAAGMVRCWGANDWGQLGDGSRAARPAPDATCLAPD